MIRFECDYGEGMHPLILEKLAKTNFEQTVGYGNDYHCKNAKKYIKKACKDENIDIHFLVGGTQANLTVISAMVKPYQGIISANTGHINVHETGSIEATGHKVLPINSTDGKIYAKDVENLITKHYKDANAEHTVQPGMVYISFPTENGTLYSKKELIALQKVCKKFNIPLFVDGARMGYGIMAKSNDLTLHDFCKYSDVFYIGGTKVGAMFGEVVVITNDAYKKDFRYMIKQRGGMLAKGRMLGIQFETLFKDNLYFDISKNAIETSELLTKALKKKGYKFLYKTQTNQLFPIMSKEKIKKLRKDFAFQDWEEVDNKNMCVRFVTSWCTKKEDVLKLIEEL